MQFWCSNIPINPWKSFSAQPGDGQPRLPLAADAPVVRSGSHTLHGQPGGIVRGIHHQDHADIYICVCMCVDYKTHGLHTYTHISI